MARSEVGHVAVVTGTRQAEGEAREPRAVTRRRGLPGGRAALGALLVSLAAVGVVLAYTGANASPSSSIVVAAHPIRPGERIDASDVRVISGDLPASTLAASFSSPADLVGRFALAPIGKGEVIQAAAVTGTSGTPGTSEIALSLPREQVAVGRLKAGERVDVFVTYDDRTASVVRGAAVVQLGAESDRSLTSEREVTIVIEVPSGEAVAALIHALRTGEVTVIRSTFTAVSPADALVFEPSAR